MTAERKRLATSYVRSRPPAEHGQHKIIRDDRLPGFYVWIGSHRRSYYCEADYRDELGRKKTKRVKLGDGNFMEAREARSLAMIELGKIKSGQYTDIPKKTKSVDATLGKAYEFMLEQKSLSRETLRQYNKAFGAERAPLRDLLDSRLADLATEQGRMLIKQRHEKLTKTSGPITANRVYEYLRTVYRYSRNRWDWLPDTPPTSMVKFNKEPRYKIPKGVDHNTVWAAIEQCENPVTRALWAATLLTGARPGEISRLKWADVNLDEQTAVVHGTKTTATFEYVLSERACEWIEKSRFDDEFVFIGRHIRHNDQKWKHLLPLYLGKFRNMYQAYAKKAKVDDIFLKMLVNHSLNDVTHGYAGQRHLLLPDLIREQERVSKALLC